MSSGIGTPIGNPIGAKPFAFGAGEIGLGLGDSGGGDSSYNPATETSMFAWVAADDPNMVTETINENFAPAAVNTVTDTIALTTTGFTRVAPYFFGICYLSTTGTLPAPFVAGTPYILVNDGSGNYSFYDYAPSYSAFPRYDADESVYAGYMYAFQRGKINITTQGTGTHTISTDPLITTIKNKKDNTDLFGTTVRAEKFRLLTDGNGPYIYQPGPVAMGSNGIEPEGPFMQDMLTAAQVGDFFENKRYAWFVAAIEALPATYFSKGRGLMEPSRLNAVTGVFTAIGHGLVNGEQVWLDALADNGVTPTPAIAFGPTITVNVLTGNTFTLASSGAATHTFLDAGTGQYVVTGGRMFRSSSSGRRVIFDGNMLANDHALVLGAAYDAYSLTIDLSSSGYFLGGGNDGEINFFLEAGRTGSNWSVLRVYLYIPSSAVGPTCDDTGVPLASGQYWMTQAGSLRRLHRTEALAQAAVGIATSSLTNTQVIKYGTLGSGFARAVPLDNFSWKGFDDGTLATGTTLATYNTPSIFVGITDYNDGGGKWRFIQGQGARNNLLNNIQTARNSPMPAKSANSNFIFGNAAQPHIAGHNKIREMMWGAMDTDPTTVVNNMSAYLAAKWGFTYTP